MALYEGSLNVNKHVFHFKHFVVLEHDRHWPYFNRQCCGGIKLRRLGSFRSDTHITLEFYTR